MTPAPPAAMPHPTLACHLGNETVTNASQGEEEWSGERVKSVEKSSVRQAVY